MKNGLIEENVYDKYAEDDEPVNESCISEKTRLFFAILVPLLLILDVVVMLILNLKGGDATALIGGTALFILIFISIFAYKNTSLEEITNYLVSGFKFGFTVFGVVIPIAAFFYLGDAGFTTIIGNHLPVGSLGIVNDLGYALSQIVPINKIFGAFTVTGIGAITGLDGSGFSGISLAGSTAQLFGTSTGASIPTLTALGQFAAIWVGGGCLIPWAIIPVSAICKVSPFEVAKRNFKPVVIGLVVTTIFAIFLI